MLVPPGTMAQQLPAHSHELKVCGVQLTSATILAHLWQCLELLVKRGLLPCVEPLLHVLTHVDTQGQCGHQALQVAGT